MNKFESNKAIWTWDIERKIRNELRIQPGSVYHEYIEQAAISILSDYHVMKKTERTENPFIRVTLLFFPFVWVILFIGLLPNYIITGSWGYSKLEWYRKWTEKLGI